MIGYGKGKIILKFPPFFRLNEENQEWGNSKHQMKTKTLNFLLLIFLVQSEEMREFQNNFSFSVPYHIQPCVCEVDFTETVESCVEGVEKWTKPMFVGGLDCNYCIGDFGSRFCYHYGICRPSFSEMYNDIQQVHSALCMIFTILVSFWRDNALQCTVCLKR